MMIFKILLYNMFIAIISAHYFEYQREQVSSSDEEEAGIIDLVINIVRNRMSSKDEDEDLKSEDGD